MGSLVSMTTLIIFEMPIIQRNHEFFEYFGVEIEIPLQIPNCCNVFFHLIENVFHWASQIGFIGLLGFIELLGLFELFGFIGLFEFTEFIGLIMFFELTGFIRSIALLGNMIFYR